MIMKILTLIIKLTLFPVAIAMFAYYLFFPKRAQATVTPVVHTHESVINSEPKPRARVNRTYKSLH